MLRERAESVGKDKTELRSALRDSDAKRTDLVRRLNYIQETSRRDYKTTVSSSEVSCLRDQHRLELRRVKADADEIYEKELTAAKDARSLIATEFRKVKEELSHLRRTHNEILSEKSPISNEQTTNDLRARRVIEQITDI